MGRGGLNDCDYDLFVSDNDDITNDDKDDNNDNENDSDDDDSNNDVLNLCSSRYKLNCWAVRVCKRFVRMFRLSGLFTCIIWRRPGEKQVLHETRT